MNAKLEVFKDREETLQFTGDIQAEEIKRL